MTAECRQPEFGAEVILVWTFQPRLLRPLHAPAQAAHICGALSILAAKHFLAEMIGGSDVESSAPPNRQLSLLGKRPKDLQFRTLYAATVFLFRLPPEIGLSGKTVSVQPFRWESRAVIAGMPSFLPIARQDKPTSSRSRTTSSRAKMRLGLPTTLPAAWAARMPDSVRSRIISRSNSATLAKICNSSRLVGFFSSVSSDWLVAMNRTPWLVSAANC